MLYWGLLRGSLFTASRFAWLRVCEYRSSIFADIQPAMAFIVDSGTPASPSHHGVTGSLRWPWVKL
jgi:hypothetical protein